MNNLNRCFGCHHFDEYEECSFCAKEFDNIRLEQRNKEKDMVANPSHYTYGKIEVIDVIVDWELDFCLGNAIKYIARCNHKGNKKQDLEKAIQYLKFELEKVK